MTPPVRPPTEHRAQVIPMKRRGWWRWRCTAGDTWCQTNSEDVAQRLAAAHEEMEIHDVR